MMTHYSMKDQRIFEFVVALVENRGVSRQATAVDSLRDLTPYLVNWIMVEEISSNLFGAPLSKHIQQQGGSLLAFWLYDV